MIDVERDDTLLGVVVESREQKLRKHLERLKHDVRHHAPNLKAWSYVQVSSKWAKSEKTYDRSGFSSFIASITAFGKDLRDLMGDRLATRAKCLAREHLDAVNQMIHKVQGETDEAEQAARVRAQKQQTLEECASQIKTIIESAFNQWQPLILPSALQYQVGQNVYVYGSEEDFERSWNDEKIRLDELKRPFLNNLDEADRTCRAVLDDVGIAVERGASKQLDNSNSVPSLATKWVSETIYERRWYTLWLHKHEKRISVKRLDKQESKENLQRYAKDIGSALVNHLGWWQDSANSSYLRPIEDEIDDHLQATQMIRHSSKQDLDVLDRIRVVLEHAINAFQQEDWGNGIHPDPPKTEPDSDSFHSPFRQRNAHPLQRLVEAYRELDFHRLLFSMIESATLDGPPRVLLALAHQGEDLMRMAALLRHDPSKRLDGPMKSPWVIFCSPDIDVPLLVGAGRSLRSRTCVIREAKAIWKRLTLVLVQAHAVRSGEIDLASTARWNILPGFVIKAMPMGPLPREVPSVRLRDPVWHVPIPDWFLLSPSEGRDSGADRIGSGRC